VRIKRRSASPLHKRARRGFRGYPIATVAFYGPEDRRASKVAVSIIADEGADADPLERWFADDDTDLRHDPLVGAQVLAFIRDHEAKTVVMPDRIIGCPHEEGVDYPEGEVCPQCPFWASRDRWTGERIQ
jgi:hypothetical protein